MSEQVDARTTSTTDTARTGAPAPALPATAGRREQVPEPAGVDRSGRSGHLVSDWWRGRFGARMLREVLLVFVLLTLYRLGRYVGRDQAERAMANAYEVLRFESWLGIANEERLQDLVLGHLWLVRSLNRYYVHAHFPVSVGFLVLLYLRANDRYVYFRRLFVVTTAAGLVLHLVYPLAPPRMLHGFVDTISRFGPAIYQRSDVASAANQYAAMPSLHFGWSVLVALGVVSVLRSRWRWVAVAHPVLTLVAIVLTANHYWLDAIVAGVLVAGAVALVSPDPCTVWRRRRLPAHGVMAGCE